MDKHLISYAVGITIVFASHIYMLALGMMPTHAVVNIFAAMCIAYYFMSRENYITF